MVGEKNAIINIQSINRYRKNDRNPNIYLNYCNIYILLEINWIGYR